MPFAVTLAQLLGQLACAELSFRREADLIGVSALVMPGGRKLLIIERVYRHGTGILLDPTPEELEIARGGDLWQIWNSDRPSPLTSEQWDWVGFGE
jgi:hypothetical protein